MAKEHIYHVKGMHCAACEVLIEKKLLEIPGVKSVQASTPKEQVTIEYDGQLPATHTLNNVFKKDNYTFFTDSQKQSNESKNANTLNPTLLAFVIAMFAVIAFLFLEMAGISGILNVTSASSLIAFFVFGVLASLSSCLALVGGIVLSMSKQWHQLYANEESFYKKFQPHLLFNTGRVLSYALGGGVLGLIGSRLGVSLSFTSFLVIAIALFMVVLALQMLGVKGFSSFQFSIPKFITRGIADEKNFQGKQMPFIMGAVTFFLPCGFTITTQTIALLSGSWIQGGLIMATFALGTAPVLLLIGISSAGFFSKPHWARVFSKTAGFLVLFFALFTITNQMNVLGVSVSDIFLPNQNQNQDSTSLAPLVNGKQIIKMTVMAVNYQPNYFKVKVGVPVVWEITSSGQPGCGNGVVIANGLTSPIYLNPGKGQVAVAEFTPQKIGRYRFTCPMGMIVGTIEVIN